MRGFFWGKVVGFVLGAARGGWLGAVVGLLAGHWVDRLIAGHSTGDSRQDVFTRSLFSCLGHIAKSDGRVTESEIQAAEILMQRLLLKPRQRRQAIAYFNQGKQPGFDLDAEIRLLAKHTALRHDLRVLFVEVLTESALSDDKISEPERFIILRICRGLRVSSALLEAVIRARRSQWQQRYQQYQHRPASQTQSLQQAFAVLGLSEKAGNAEIKRAYRKLMSRYHPDKLVGQGMPEHMLEVAKQKVKDVNTAYDRIKAAKGIK